MTDILLQKAASLLRPVPDFPKAGILFWDIAPLLRDPEIFLYLVSAIAQRWRYEKVQVVAGFDARGFIFGTAVAQKLGVAFEQIRKKGKLPGKTKGAAYALEYGEAEIEMLDDGFIKGKNVLLIDDLLATGGTAMAGVRLVEELGGTVVGFSVITELPELGGRGILADYVVHSLVSIVEDQPVIDIEYCVDIVAYDEEIDSLVLINRLNDPLGISMIGGRIENESARAAIVRELSEESSCTPTERPVHMATLSGLKRDPRGVKVSTVFASKVKADHYRDEPGKTSVYLHHIEDELPVAERFAFDHGRFLHDAVIPRFSTLFA